jgi:hypothetical protein
LIQGISRNVSLSNDLTELRLYNIRFQSEFAEFLCEALKANTSLSCLFINYCDLISESSDIIIRGLIEHTKIEILDLSNNFLDDKSGYMVSRLINRQSERRDQTVWKFGLRNELPFGPEFKRGLAAVNLSDNFLSDNSADCFASALQTDTYLRSLCLSRNQIFLEGCKKLVRAMRRNGTLLNLDIKDNYGYNENIHKRILVKISRNIKAQFKNFNEHGIGYCKDNDYLKDFINYEFFNVEIPQEFVEKYQMLMENAEYRIGNGYEANDCNANYSNANLHSNQQQYINNPFASFGNPNCISYSNNLEMDHNYHADQESEYYLANKANNYNSNNNKAFNNADRYSKYDNEGSDGSEEEDLINENAHTKNINLKERKPSNAKNTESNNSINNNNYNAKNAKIVKIDSKNSIDKNNAFRNLTSNNTSKNKSSNFPKEKSKAKNNQASENLPNTNNKSKQNSSDNSTNTNNKRKNMSSSGAANFKQKANLDEKRFEFKVEKTNKIENKSKSEDIQFELEADNEYDKIINEENENDEDFIFRNYSDGEIFLKNEITNEINYSLPQNNQTNIDTYFAKDNNNKNDIEFNYNKNANRFFEKNKFCRCSRDFKKVYVDINKKNKLLFFENLKLRKQLLTLRAINLSMNQQRFNNNNCNITSSLIFFLIF